MFLSNLGIEPDEIAIVGDLHSNLDAAIRSLITARYKDIDTVIQVGDFGYWGNNTNFFKGISNFAKNLDMKILFIDGNHDDHELLKNFKKDKDGIKRLSDSIWYMPRGTMWEWNSTTFLAVGGAMSVDYKNRVKGIDWFPEEVINNEETINIVEKVKKINKKIDIMFTHDVPNNVKTPMRDREIAPEILEEVQLSRERLGSIVNIANPKKLYHGHHHKRYTTQRKNSDGTTTIIEGLGKDGQTHDEHMVFLNLKEV